jgi:hypothetical protein
MTFVGKILVVLITVFAMIFLGISLVVFTTEKNWKEQSTKLSDDIKKLNSTIQATKNQLTSETENLKHTKDEASKQEKLYKAQIDQLKNDNDQREKEVGNLRTEIAKALQTQQSALEEAEAHRKETEELRGILSAVQKQANDYGLRQTELNDQIRILTRQLDTAVTSNKTLRENVALLTGSLQKAGLPSDPKQLRGIAGGTPPVEGYVKRVARNRVEISIGADDGLVVGHELEVWRTKPEPEYLGKIRLESVDPDQSVGVVVGKTVQGKKIEENDNVGSTIRPR